MEPKPTAKQTLFLWRLLVEDDGVFISDLKPKFGAPDRKALEAAGLIQVEPRRKPNSREAMHVALTDAGWYWAEQNLDAELPEKGIAALFVLRQVMSRLKTRVLQGQFSLAEFFTRPPRADSTQPVVARDSVVTLTAEQPPITEREHRRDLSRRIIAACQHLTHGAYSGRVRLAELRSSLADVSRSELDRTLLELERERQVVVYPLDNPQEITDSDTEAALPNSSGNPRHILVLQATG